MFFISYMMVQLMILFYLRFKPIVLKLKTVPMILKINNFSADFWKKKISYTYLYFVVLIIHYIFTFKISI